MSDDHLAPNTSIVFRSRWRGGYVMKKPSCEKDQKETELEETASANYEELEHKYADLVTRYKLICEDLYSIRFRAELAYKSIQNFIAQDNASCDNKKD